MRCIASSVVIGILRTIDSNVFENHGSITLLTGLKYSFELIRFFILTEEQGDIISENISVNM